LGGAPGQGQGRIGGFEGAPRDRIREPAEECGLPYEDPIREALDALTQSSSVRRTQSEARSGGGAPEQHSKRDRHHHPEQEACLGARCR
jgi:hypothetical protein